MIKLTQERIENLLEFNSGEVDGSAANAEAWEVHELARIALIMLGTDAAIDEPGVPPVEPCWNDATLREPGIWAYGFLEGQQFMLNQLKIRDLSGGEEVSV